MYDSQAWYKAISDRHSVRKYIGDPVTDSALAKIVPLCDGFSPLCKGARGYLIKGDAENLFTGLVGPFGRITGPDSAVAFAVDSGSPRHLEAAGYLGEGIVLEATSLGLGTCWVAGSFSRNGVMKRVAPGDDWKVIAITPLGTASASKGASRGLSLARLFTRSHSRKPLSVTVSGLPKEKWPALLDKVFEAARWAPSAVNRQPWRYVVDGNGVTLSAQASLLSLDYLRRVDCGIAMLHFEVAARALGVGGEWRFVDEPAVARFDYA